MVEYIEHHRRLVIATMLLTGSLGCYVKNILVLYGSQK